MKTASISDVLAKCEPPVHMKCRVVGTYYGVLPILVNEATRLLLECSFGLLSPPVAESSRLVIFSAVVVEGVTEFARFTRG